MTKTVIGDRFGRLEVLEPRGMDHARKFMWLVRCECGTEKVVRDNGLRTGNSKSCGCLNREETAARNTKYGLGTTPESQVWRDMRKRCLNPRDPNYPNYGGRGIKIAPEWEDDFLKFLGDVGYRPDPKETLDRIDNSKGYEPGNVRWVSMKVQQRNKRNSLWVTIGDETKTAAEWSEVYGLDKSTMLSRMRKAKEHGIPLDTAFRCPTDKVSFMRLKVQYGYTPRRTRMMEAR